MKQIEITGKHNRYEIKKLQPPTIISISENKISYEDQYYMLFNENLNTENTLVLHRIIQGKLSGYRQQDIKKNCNPDMVISLQDTLSKLRDSKLQCDYCERDVVFFYNTRDPLQWSLDRIDNKRGHEKDNVVISCLDCNLRKKSRSFDKFLFTKRLNIVKST